MTHTVKTGKAGGRRDLRFTTIAEVSAELNRIEAAHNDGSLRAVGAWSAGQILEHLAIVWDASYDGFSFKAPIFIRLLGPLLKKKMFGDKPIPAGLQLRGPSAVMIPPENVSFEHGLARLRAAIARTTRGEKMTQRSPVFGHLSHEQWTALHLKHCALHLSFLIPD